MKMNFEWIISSNKPMQRELWVWRQVHVFIYISREGSPNIFESKTFQKYSCLYFRIHIKVPSQLRAICCRWQAKFLKCRKKDSSRMTHVSSRSCVLAPMRDAFKKHAAENMYEILLVTDVQVFNAVKWFYNSYLHFFYYLILYCLNFKMQRTKRSSDTSLLLNNMLAIIRYFR